MKENFIKLNLEYYVRRIVGALLNEGLIYSGKWRKQKFQQENKDKQGRYGRVLYSIYSRLGQDGGGRARGAAPSPLARQGGQARQGTVAPGITVEDQNGAIAPTSSL